MSAPSSVTPTYASLCSAWRAVDAQVRPSENELQQMERLLEEALDAGLLGLSSMTNPWDKLDGERQRSKSLPSVYAPWAEYARLNKILRRRGCRQTLRRRSCRSGNHRPKRAG